MKTTVITVVLNNALTIADSIESVLNQNIQNYEHLIVDGGSMDGTLAVIKEKSNSDITLISEKDNGIYDAMNKGVRLAKGDIVGFLNADDIYYDDAVLTSVQALFAQDPALEIVYGDLVYVRQNDTQKVVRTWKGTDYSAFYFEAGHVPPHPAFFVRREALLKTRGFDTSYKIAADYELMFRLLKVEGLKSVYLPKVLVRMRLGGVSNRSARNISAGNLEIIRAWRKHNQAIPVQFWPLRYFRKLRQFW